MAKYELFEKTEVNNEVWYFIRKDGNHVDYTYTQNYEEAHKKLAELVDKTRPSEPIIKIIKTIETDEN